jgi:hypothetical protein
MRLYAIGVIRHTGKLIFMLMYIDSVISVLLQSKDTIMYVFKDKC